jgi:hypothetical protein
MNNKLTTPKITTTKKSIKRHGLELIEEQQSLSRFSSEHRSAPLKHVSYKKRNKGRSAFNLPQPAAAESCAAALQLPSFPVARRMHRWPGSQPVAPLPAPQD